MTSRRPTRPIFSPENIAHNWIPKHQLALDLARQAWLSRHSGGTPAAIVSGAHVSARAGTAPAGAATAAGLPATAAAAAAVATGRPDPAARATPAGVASAESPASTAEQREAQAWTSSAFADHFLTDAFASGHLITGDRTIPQTFYDANANGITAAAWECAVADGVDVRDASIIVPTIRAFIASRASSLLLKTVHDYYNRTGVEVRNALGQVWRTVGDAHLGGSPETRSVAWTWCPPLTGTGSAAAPARAPRPSASATLATPWYGERSGRPTRISSAVRRPGRAAARPPWAAARRRPRCCPHRATGQAEHVGSRLSSPREDRHAPTSRSQVQNVRQATYQTGRSAGSAARPGGSTAVTSSRPHAAMRCTVAVKEGMGHRGVIDRK